jgi:hypothetical protein
MSTTALFYEVAAVNAIEGEEAGIRDTADLLSSASPERHRGGNTGESAQQQRPHRLIRARNTTTTVVTGGNLSSASIACDAVRP